MRWPHQKELLRLIDSFIESLMLGPAVDSNQMADCHAAKLMLERNKEKRIRSLQTLASMRHPKGIAPLFKEMMTYARAWPGGRTAPNKQIEEASELLVESFREFVCPTPED